MTFNKKNGILFPMKAYEYTQSFSVKYCEADFKDELKVSTALSYMEEVACASADELGFGYAYIKPRNYAFMVSNICCEFISPVCLGELITVKTWPTPPTHVIFGREYQFLGKLGEIRANASSRWCLIDMQSGKLLPSKILDNQDYSSYNTAKALDNVQWKIPVFPIEEGELKFSFVVANSEYDHNMHVNNTRYADYCLNCFSIEELSQKRLKRFCISYVKQCKEGERLSFYRKEMDGAYVVQGLNEKRERVMLAQIVFKDEVEKE